MEVIQAPRPDRGVPVEQIFYGRQEAVDSLFIKQQLLSENRLAEAAQRRIVAYWMGGGNAVANEVGGAIALQELGMLEDGTVDVVLLASGGSVVGSRVLAGTGGEEGIFEELCKRGFAGLQHLRRGGIAAISILREVLAMFPLDEKKLASLTAQVLVLTAHGDGEENGTLRARDIRHLANPDEEICASCTIQELTVEKRTEVEGRLFCDGGIPGIPWDIIMELNPTDVIIFASGPIEMPRWLRNVGKAGKWLGDVVFGDKDPARRDLLAFFHNGWTSVSQAFELNWQEVPSVNVAIFAPERSDVGPLTMDITRIKKATADSIASMRRHLRPSPMYEAPVAQMTS